MTSVDAAQSIAAPLRPKPPETLWLTRGERWMSVIAQSTTDEQDMAEDQSEESSEPLVNRPQYDPPKRILKHPSSQLAVINQITALSTHEEAEIADEEPGETQITLSDESGARARSQRSVHLIRL
ncbi:hypothetical protein PI125_g18556 [Phytophthora idaei]|nr:hypothetical protein PI125_g18556 [Phytophthora idaei]